MGKIRPNCCTEPALPNNPYLYQWQTTRLAHHKLPAIFARADQLNDYLDYVRAVATRYRGKIHHYQIWNEPNIYPEWGEQAVNPAADSEMLCASYHVIKEIDPTAVVLAAALVFTIELGPRNLNEFLFLERMYAAGARECFDVLHTGLRFVVWPKRPSPTS